MPKIRQLTEDTINKIAAGEVVENPASVIKELIENSIDAGALQLLIEVKGGGFQLIKVVDDGCGMNREDALLCFERHATSKISHIDDLASLHSMGFRGEALASIAAISRIEMVTAVSDGEGVRIDIEGGKILNVGPAPRKAGTTFEIRSLFYNVPARKKFQKSASASSAEIHRIVIHLALAHPEVGFEFISHEETVLKVAPVAGSFLVQLQQRIADLFQESFLTTRSPLEGEERSHQLRGFLGSPSDHRINRMGQYLFVNRRPIFSSQISAAIKEGYGERLPEDRYPVFILHLDIPPSCLDVNVHPQKREVRFEERDFIRQFVKTKVQRSFAPSPASAAPHFEPIREVWDAPLQFREDIEEPSPLLEEEVIGVFGRFLLLNGSTVAGYNPGVVWVDLQKVQEQLLWHQMNGPDKTLFSQGLLLPLSMELTPDEMGEFSERQKDFERCGFTVQQSGKSHLLIEAIPPFLSEADVTEAVRFFLRSEEPFPQLAAKLAHFAVRRKQKFMLQEALTLWKSFKQHNFREGMAWTSEHVIESFFKASGKGASDFASVEGRRDPH